MRDIKMIMSEGEPSPKNKECIVTGLLSHHVRQGHPRKSTTLSVLLKDDNKNVWGGIMVTFLWNGMEINALWVDESIRKQGWGHKLMRVVEQEAIKRGCTIAYTNTFSWQAPEFYEKLGYKLYGKLDNFPKGSSLSYFSKQL